jgi:hypothetical protein
MKALILRYGIIAGVIVTIPLLWNWLALTPEDKPITGMLFGYLIIVVSLTMVFVGMKAYRDKVMGGVVCFMPAFAVGLGISAVASLFYIVSWEICMAYSSWDFIAYYKAAMIDSAKAAGATPEQVQTAVAEADAFATMYQNPLFRIPMTFLEIFPVGLLISLVSAAVLRNPRVLPAKRMGSDPIS